MASPEQLDIADGPGSHVNPMVAVVVLCFGGLCAALTQTFVIPIQSELPQLLGTSAANAAGSSPITLLAAAVSMPIAGRLADLFGKQRVLTASAAILLVGSLVCALSDTLVPMLAGRALQGMAMGFIPVGISLMREITPPQLTGSAVAAMSATLGVGGAIGLPLSAWIVDAADWHDLFWAASVLAAVVVALTWYAVPHVHDAQPGRFDVVGAVGLAPGPGLPAGRHLQGHRLGLGRTRARSAPSWPDCVVLLTWSRYELRQRSRWSTSARPPSCPCCSRTWPPWPSASG